MGIDRPQRAVVASLLPRVTSADDRAAADVVRLEPRIGVFVVDDHTVVREGLSAILAREQDMEVVGEAGTAEDALDGIASIGPDVILVDYSLPGMTGIDLCREIAERRLPGQVLILSGYLDAELARLALLSGARAYVLKDVDPQGLKHAIRAAASGQTTVDSQLGPRVLTSFWTSGTAGSPEPLTSDEGVALRLLVAGEPDRLIAAFLGIDRKELPSLLRGLYRKLGVRSRAQAVAHAGRRSTT